MDEINNNDTFVFWITENALELKKAPVNWLKLFQFFTCKNVFDKQIENSDGCNFLEFLKYSSDSGIGYVIIYKFDMTHLQPASLNSIGKNQWRCCFPDIEKDIWGEEKSMKNISPI